LENGLKSNADQPFAAYAVLKTNFRPAASSYLLFMIGKIGGSILLILGVMNGLPPMVWGSTKSKLRLEGGRAWIFVMRKQL
jgi:hypothetical protein